MATQRRKRDARVSNGLLAIHYAFLLFFALAVVLSALVWIAPTLG